MLSRRRMPYSGFWFAPAPGVGAAPNLLPTAGQGQAQGQRQGGGQGLRERANAGDHAGRRRPARPRRGGARRVML